MTTKGEINPKLILQELRENLENGQLGFFIGPNLSCLKEELNSVKNIVEFVQNKSTQEIINELQRFSQEITVTKLRCFSLLKTHTLNSPLIATCNIDRFIEKYIIADQERYDSFTLKELLDDDVNIKNIHKDLELQRTLLIKCFGDISNSNKKLCSEVNVKAALNNLKQDNQLFDVTSLLFLGVSHDDIVIKDLIEKSSTSKFRNYFYFDDAELKGEKAKIDVKGQAILIHSPLTVTEFVHFLSPEKIKGVNKDIIYRNIWPKTFLKDQRAEYLKMQLVFEEQAEEIIYHTQALTNALSPDDLLDNESGKAIKDMLKNNPFATSYDEPSLKDDSLNSMKNRRDHLKELIDNAGKDGRLKIKSIIALFDFKDLEMSLKRSSVRSDAEIRQLIKKHTEALLIAKSVRKPNSILELIGVVEDNARCQLAKEKFAFIKISSNNDQNNQIEATMFAEQAIPQNKNSLQVTAINVNDNEVQRRKQIVENTRRRVMNNTIVRLCNILWEAENQFNALPDKQKKSLLNLVEAYNISNIKKFRVPIDHNFQKIGSGSFGDVYKCSYEYNNKYIDAVLKLMQTDGEDSLQKLIKEFKCARDLKHENIVKVYQATEKNSALGIIMEYMPGGDIQKNLDNGKFFYKGNYVDWVCKCSLQIASALEYLHDTEKKFHRDIKPDNIFLSYDWEISKLGDFGEAKQFDKTYTGRTAFRGAKEISAPEVRKVDRIDSTGKKIARYSVKADVYSYGHFLMYLLEKDKLDKFSKKNNSSINDRQKLEYDNIIKNLMVIYNNCMFLSQHYRPTMKIVKEDLENVRSQTFKTNRGGFNEKQKLNVNGIDILCLGTGTGSTTVLHGEPSSSFVISFKNEPFLLIDMGLGVYRQYISYFPDKLPKYIYITHNHSDHSGDLPVGILLMNKFRKKDMQMPILLAESNVMKRIFTHRFHEMESNADMKTILPREYLNSLEPYELESEFTMKLHKSQHGELCYGFLLEYKNKPIFGYTADSGFEKNLYRHVFQAPVVFVDGRNVGTKEHAGFDEIAKFVKDEYANDQKSIYIIGYGIENESPKSIFNNEKWWEIFDSCQIETLEIGHRLFKINDDKMFYKKSFTYESQDDEN